MHLVMIPKAIQFSPDGCGIGTGMSRLLEASRRSRRARACPSPCPMFRLPSPHRDRDVPPTGKKGVLTENEMTLVMIPCNAVNCQVQVAATDASLAAYCILADTAYAPHHLDNVPYRDRDRRTSRETATVQLSVR